MFAFYRNYLYVLIGDACGMFASQVGWLICFWLQTARGWGRQVGERLNRK